MVINELRLNTTKRRWARLVIRKIGHGNFPAPWRQYGRFPFHIRTSRETGSARLARTKFGVLQFMSSGSRWPVNTSQLQQQVHVWFMGTSATPSSLVSHPCSSMRTFPRPWKQVSTAVENAVENARGSNYGLDNWKTTIAFHFIAYNKCFQPQSAVCFNKVIVASVSSGDQRLLVNMYIQSFNPVLKQRHKQSVPITELIWSDAIPSTEFKLRYQAFPSDNGARIGEERSGIWMQIDDDFICNVLSSSETRCQGKTDKWWICTWSTWWWKSFGGTTWSPLYFCLKYFSNVKVVSYSVRFNSSKHIILVMVPFLPTTFQCE